MKRSNREIRGCGHQTLKPGAKRLRVVVRTSPDAHERREHRQPTELADELRDRQVVCELAGRAAGEISRANVLGHAHDVRAWVGGPTDPKAFTERTLVLP